MQKKIIYILIIQLLFYSCDFTSADEYFNQAYEYEEKGELTKAIELLDKSIEKQSDFRPALLNRGYYKTELGNLNEGIEDYKKILEFDADNTLALYNIGMNFQNLENPEKAIEYFTKALNTNGALTCFPNSNGGTLGLRTSLDFDEFDNENDFEVHKCEIQFSRGVNYFFKKEFDKAIPDFESSIKANYNSANSHYFLAGIYLEKRNLTKLVKTLSCQLI